MGFVQFDQELNHSDFRCGQKAFTLLIHLRQMVKEKFLIQTRLRDNYSLQAALKMDFEVFYEEELKFRKELKLPPFGHLVEISLRGAKEDFVLQESQRLFEALEKSKPKGMEVMDSQPDLVPKLRDKYRYTIMLKGKSVEKMIKFAKAVLKNFKRRKKLIITLNVDP